MKKEKGISVHCYEVTPPKDSNSRWQTYITVASELFNNGVPVEIIRNYLGDSDIKTTWVYILDKHRKEETTKMILKTLENLNGLKRTQAS